MKNFHIKILKSRRLLFKIIHFREEKSLKSLGYKYKKNTTTEKKTIKIIKRSNLNN